MLQDQDAAGKEAATRPVDRSQGIAPLPAEAPPDRAGEASGAIGMELDKQPAGTLRSSIPAGGIATDRPQPIPAEREGDLGPKVRPRTGPGCIVWQGSEVAGGPAPPQEAGHAHATGFCQRLGL